MKQPIQRGDIFYITDNPDYPEIGSEMWSNRMGIILSAEPIVKTSRVFSILWLSTSPNKRQSPTHVELTVNHKKAIAICEFPTHVDVTRLKDKVDHISDEEKIRELEQGILLGFGINTGFNPQGLFKKWERNNARYHLQPEIEFPKQPHPLTAAAH